MRIADVCAFYTPRGGGVKTYSNLKIDYAGRNGHQMIIVAPGETDRIEHRANGSKIVWIASPRFPLDRNYRYFDDPEVLHRVLDREAPDLVEVSSPWRSASVVADWDSQVPRVLFMHADPLATFAYRWFEDIAGPAVIDRGFDWYWRHLRRLDHRYEAVISASRSLSDRLANGGLGGIVTNPMGIDPRVFTPRHRDPELRRALLDACGLPETATLLLGVGRFAPEKRWPMVIKAVSAAGCEEAVGLVLIGDGRDRARVVRAVGDNPHILLHPPTASRARMARLMASADAVVHGMESETFCIVAAEARASGTPLIVPDRGGAADQIASAGGWVYRSTKAASLAAAIVDFVRDTRTMYVAPREARAPQRTMDEHFGDLFAFYATLGRRPRQYPAPRRLAGRAG